MVFVDVVFLRFFTLVNLGLFYILCIPILCAVLFVFDFVFLFLAKRLAGKSMSDMTYFLVYNQVRLKKNTKNQNTHSVIIKKHISCNI